MDDLDVVLCVMDSVGKTAGKGARRQFHQVVAQRLEQHCQIELDVIFRQGARLGDLISAALSRPVDGYDMTLLLSFGNDLVTQAGNNVSLVQWHSRRGALCTAMRRFASACRGRPHEVVFGGIGTMWRIPNPEIFDERVEDICLQGQDLGLSMTNARDWLQGLTQDHWCGMHLVAADRELAVRWMVDNMLRTFSNRKTTSNAVCSFDSVCTSLPSIVPPAEMFKYRGPDRCDSYQKPYYFDEILNKSVWDPAELNADKAYFLPRLQHLGSVQPFMQNAYRINLVHEARPTVFLLMSGDTATISQAVRGGSR